MNNEYTQAEQAFRDEVRQFLSENLPEDIRRKVLLGMHLTKEDCVRWQKILYRRGWAAANWPTKHGGTGWSATQKSIFETECALAGAPEVVPFGLKMVAPVIFTFGSEQQKQRFLPDILASNVWWCQGYSEPNAGSDLASLKTTAYRDGDHYVVNGTKTWTTLAHYADWIFCLVRTGGSQGKNQTAISFLLIDMHTPGITLSPILTLDGYREVNEVHFDNVRVPVENRIGEEGQGWTYAKVLLTHERTNIARVAHSRCQLQRARELAGATPDGDTTLMENPVFAHKFAEIEIELLALEYTELRTLDAVRTGQAPGPESSILKIRGTELAQSIDELHAEIAACGGLPYLPWQLEEDFDGERVATDAAINSWLRYFNNRKSSIYGGSNEIQKNIICKAVLGL
ncbi:acyl-CoA dehydrogenase family protein [Microbulbifer pacificus]|uniref:Acyl-CoA dehydrogenase family protein n=1 Tax=Microbulbifer pacificus TaxID=407164 RepID=A0AAU0N1X1_9GAMM|nr:acyl-CoA dehydrogenase family protein [Microbulbifer pacificus]WOX06254.1 acyl-CoA dehydrogenase family protein [Microbulbifer pacificus]